MWRNIVKNLKSIAVVGVDGTGKSTVVQSILDYFGGDKAVVQYMGLREWETPLAQKCYSKKSAFWYRLARFATINELHHRVYKYKNDQRIVVFDRYVDEQILQFRKHRKTIFGYVGELLYKWSFGKRFYRPSLLFYMTCDLEVSIARKDDIQSEDDIRRLKQNKTLMDAFYKDRPGVFCIDTTKLTIEETLNEVISVIKEKKCFNI